MDKLVIILFFLLGMSSCSKEHPNINCTVENPCSNESIKVLNTIVGGELVVLVYSKALNFYQSFSRSSILVDELVFESVLSSFPIIMKDQLGNSYDVFGKVVEGPNLNTELQTVKAGIGFWFVWSSVYPKILFKDEIGEGQNISANDPDWEINTDFVNQGAALDGITALNLPEFRSYTNKDIFTSSLLLDHDEIIVVKMGDVTRIYPIKILNYHEIVNDTMAGIPFVVCYAPYTHTSSVWKRRINKLTLEFGVSGNIYNNNILLFDRTTSSLWSQLLEQSVNGPFQKTKVERISYFRTTWETWRETGDKHNILVGEEKLDFDYSIDPLGDYNGDHSYLPFRISNTDDRLKSKEKVYGIEVNGEVVAYQFF